MKTDSEYRVVKGTTNIPAAGVCWYSICKVHNDRITKIKELPGGLTLEHLKENIEFCEDEFEDIEQIKQAFDFPVLEVTVEGTKKFLIEIDEEQA